MANPQNPPIQNPPAKAVPSEPAPSMPAMIVLSKDDSAHLDSVIGPSPMLPLMSAVKPMVSPSQEATDAAAALTACRAGQFCDEDVAPPLKAKITRDFHAGPFDGKLTGKPGKVELTFPFKNGWRPR